MIDKKDKRRINADRIRACIMNRTEAAESVSGNKFYFKEEYPISEDDKTQIFKTSITLDKSKECAYIDVQVCEIEETFFENVAVVCAKLTKTISPCCFWFSDNEAYMRTSIDYQNEMINNQKVDHAIKFLLDGMKYSYTIVKKAALGKLLTIDELFTLDNTDNDDEELLEEPLSDILTRNHVSCTNNSEEDRNVTDSEDDDEDLVISEMPFSNPFEEGSILDRLLKQNRANKHDELFDRLAAEKENQEE